MTLAEDLVAYHERARADRQVWNVNWQEIAEYIHPNMAEFLVTWYPGMKRMQKIMDTTGMQARERCALGIHQKLTPKGQTWFYLKFADHGPEPSRTERLWLDTVASCMLNVFNDPRRGFHTMMREKLDQLIAFGTGPGFIGEDPGGGGPYFQGISLVQAHATLDDRYQVVGVSRQFKQTAWQIAQSFGRYGPLPETVRKSLELRSQDEFDVLHVVRPRLPDEEDAGPGSQSWPWLSAYVFKPEMTLLAPVSGFREFPYAMPRWDRSPSEIYGRGPGWNAIPDVKMMQEAAKGIIKNWHKQNDPPLLVDDEAGIRPKVNTLPGHVTYGTRDAHGNWNVKYMEPPNTLGNVDHVMGSLKARVESLFYLDLLRLPGPETQDGAALHMSATEAAIRSRQQLEGIGPILSRLEQEDLVPMIRRTYAIMVRAGMIPPPPDTIRGRQVIPEYVSPLAIAARAQDVDSINQLMGYMAPIAEKDPTIWDMLDYERMVQVYADRLRVPFSIMATEQEIQAKGQQRQQSQQMQAQAQAQALQAQANKDNATALQLGRATGG